MDLFEKIRKNNRSNQCPHCGYVHSSLPSIEIKIYKYKKSFFALKDSYQVDVLTCDCCGEKWESAGYPTKKSLEKIKNRNKGGWKKVASNIHNFITNS